MEDSFLKAFMRRFRIEGEKIREDAGRDVIVMAEVNGLTPRPMNFDELIAWYIFLDSARHEIPSDRDTMEKIIAIARELVDRTILTEDIEKEVKERSEKGKSADIVSLMLSIQKRANNIFRIIQAAATAIIEERLARLLAEHFVMKGEIPLSEEFIEKHREEYEEIASSLPTSRSMEIIDKIRRALEQR